MKRSIPKGWRLAPLLPALGCAGPGGDEPTTYQEARSAVVYGEDDRREPCAYPPDSQLFTWSRSSAMLVPRSSLRPGQTSRYVLASPMTLSDFMSAIGQPLCPEEPFRSEPVFSAACSAFLAAPDVVITAGHCLRHPGMCPAIAFVFGVAYDWQSRDPSQLGAEDVYFCEEVLEQAQIHGGADYALVRLDRPVTGRAPLPLRRAGKIADDEELVLIGNPLGLPTKIAAGGEVLDNAPEALFKASTDSYGGESGSVVLGARSGLVEGVLVRGERDFEQRGDCWVSKVCPERGSPCRGEDVSRGTLLAAALDKH